MAEDQVQDQCLELRGEIGQAVHGLLGQGRADLDVPEQTPFNGVFEADLPTELADLADVMQDHAGEKQVAVEERVMRGDAVGEGAEADDVLQQAAQPGVMKLLGGGCFAVGLRQRRIASNVVSNSLRSGLAMLSTKPTKLPPERGDVVNGRWQQIGLVDFEG